MSSSKKKQLKLEQDLECFSSPVKYTNEDKFDDNDILFMQMKQDKE